MMYPPSCKLMILIQLLIFTPSQSLSNGNNHGYSLYCESWRFSVETNNAVNWSSIPDRCYEHIKDYMIGDQYVSDTNLVAHNALEFAKSADIAADGKDGWILDVDDTLLSHLPYYQAYGFGAKAQNNEAFKTWVVQAKAPALHTSLRLYKELHQLGFAIFIMTGRPEPYRNITESNLLYAGFTNWKKLIMRGTSDEGKLAIDYKSHIRKELQDEGCRIHGNVGDQW
ncbi:Acid phosphatase 1, partial [Bienertia sinuspersici]